MKALITGGAGFIGSNLALFLTEKGHKVKVFDNFSRKGTLYNAKTLKNVIPANKLEIVKGDVRNYKAVLAASNTDVVFHLAAQTAVTTSVIDPRRDMDVNISGTFNVLEAARTKKNKPIVIYSSTNKVYGSLEGVKIFKPVSEEMNLDFHSPYGVSKGSADSYVKDYYRVFGVPTVVFRQSCIYGPMQLGIEDQGWVAHMAARAVTGQAINIFGDGNQIRDLLYISDLVDAYMKAIENINKVKGEVFNVGGGKSNAVSVVGYLDFLEEFLNKKIITKRFKARVGDQKYYVSDNGKAGKILDWHAVTSYKIGLPLMIGWISQNRALFEKINENGR